MEAAVANGSGVKFTFQIRQRVAEMKSTMAVSSRPSYIYFLLEPDADIVRYVGCCSDPEARYRIHVGSGATRRIREWVCTLKSCGELPRMKVVLTLNSFGRYEDVEWCNMLLHNYWGHVSEYGATLATEKWLIECLTTGAYCSNDHPKADLLNISGVPKIF